MSWKKSLNMRRGGALVMTALSAIFMLGMTALVTDVGYLYYSQSRLQTAVNAGWKAGYDRMLEKVTGRYVPAPGSAQDNEIRAHISEVMQQNGISVAGLKSLVISYTPLVPRQSSGYYLRVEATQNVGLFFAKIMSFATSDVYAWRENHINDLGQGVVPLGIPHGNVRDESRSTFSFAKFSGNQGFTNGGEYLLKLGSGGGNVKFPKNEQVVIDEEGNEEILPGSSTYLLYIPMETTSHTVENGSANLSGMSQTQAGLVNAYGAVFACLRTPTNLEGNVPVYWLLGYNGGAFVLKYTDALKARLQAAGTAANFIEISSDTDTEAIFTAANPHILELFNQPYIAVYSNNPVPSSTDVATTLASAGIVLKSSDYLNDSNIARISEYHLVLMASEDMTGYVGGCSNYARTCESYLNSGAFTGPGKKEEEFMCPYCQARFVSSKFNLAQYISNYDKKIEAWGDETNYSNVIANCEFKNKRCSERVASEGTNKEKIYGLLKTTGGVTSFEYTTLICGIASNTQCAGFTKASHALGELAPFTTVVPPTLVAAKRTTAEAIKNHVSVGGFLFATGFSAETLDLTLRMKYGSDAECMAFTGFDKVDFPGRSSYVRYSDINVASESAAQLFNLLYREEENDPAGPPDPRSQNHSETVSTAIAETNAFNKYTDTTVELSTGANPKYIKGSFGDGQYCYLAGRIGSSVEAKRLILNNVLYADTCEKVVSDASWNLPVSSKQKGKYGPLDPDNYVGGGANDYRDWFMTGFNQPLQLWDRIITENGNMRGPTDQAVEFRTEGDADTPPSRRIIVPITDIPPEVAAHQPTANSIYSLQGNDNPGGVYTPDLASFTSAIRIIGFAEFELLGPDEFTDDANLGPYQPGQVRGKFIRYIIDPREVAGQDPYVN